MGRIFNIVGDCKPDQYYMVNMDSRLAEIRKYVDRGEYFAINRARQYGKTTTLRGLKEYLKDDYYVVSMDFQMQMSGAKFRNENAFSIAFAKAFIRIVGALDVEIPPKMTEAVNCLKEDTQQHKEDLELVELFQHISDICRAADRPVVLMIDGVDSASNNQVFLDFLAQLRGYYLNP